MIGRWLRGHRFAAGVLCGLLGAGVSALCTAFCIVAFGLFDVSATSLHSAPAAWLIHTTMVRSVHARENSVGQPPRLSNADVNDGAVLYRTRCQMCHGAPGMSRAHWPSGLTPTPPYLIDASRQWSPRELRLIVGKGIKMTAMPAWEMTLSDKQLWAIVAFLEKLPKLNRENYLEAVAVPKPKRQPSEATGP